MNSDYIVVILVMASFYEMCDLPTVQFQSSKLLSYELSMEFLSKSSSVFWIKFPPFGHRRKDKMEEEM